LRTIANICTEWIGRVSSPFVIQHQERVHEGAEEVERRVPPAYINARKPPRTTAAGTTRAWHWAEVAPLVWLGMTLPLELELELEAVFVASVPVTAVAVTLGEAVVPFVEVTVAVLGRVVEETVGVTVTAVVAPPDEVLTVAGMLKAGQALSKLLIVRVQVWSMSGVGCSA